MLSVHTLGLLAERLGVTRSYLLGEEALLDQLARALLLTTQLLEKHELTAQEEGQCFQNQALLAKLAPGMQWQGVQTNIPAAEPSRT